MSSSESMPIGEFMASWRERAAEHRRRMDTDPAYRAEVEEQERKEAEEEQKRIAEMREKARLDAIRSRRIRIGIPQRAWSTLDAPAETAAMAAAMEFALKGPETLLVLAGGVGCGKSIAAWAAAEEFAKAAEERRGNGFGAMPCSRPDARTLKAIDLARAGSFDREFWDALEEPRLLIIDDLGTEPLDEKGWALANLLALLDTRYDALSKTILTTNLPMPRFRARYCEDGGRLLDRLREVGAFMEITDASLRRSIA